MKRFTTMAIAIALGATTASADTYIERKVPGSFDDVAFAVENAIIGQGLVIDMVSHVGDMLERTRADMNSEQVLFGRADIFVFCSASASRAVMEADPSNIQYCPYGIQVIEAAADDATVIVAYVERSSPSMAPVNALLAAIVADAVGAE